MECIKFLKSKSMPLKDIHVGKSVRENVFEFSDINPKFSKLVTMVTSFIHDHELIIHYACILFKKDKI